MQHKGRSIFCFGRAQKCGVCHSAHVHVDFDSRIVAFRSAEADGDGNYVGQRQRNCAESRCRWKFGSVFLRLDYYRFTPAFSRLFKCFTQRRTPNDDSPTESAWYSMQRVIKRPLKLVVSPERRRACAERKLIKIKIDRSSLAVSAPFRRFIASVSCFSRTRQVFRPRWDERIASVTENNRFSS